MYKNSKNAPKNDVKTSKTHQNFILIFGEENDKLIKRHINEIFDEIYHEIVNKNPNVSWEDYIMYQAPRLLMANTSSTKRKNDKSIFSFVYYYLLLKCKDYKLHDHFLKKNRHVIRYVKYLLKDALLTLGKKLSNHFENKLGLPHGSLVFRYDFVAENNKYVFDKYVFALYVRKDLKIGDRIGDWIVLSNGGLNFLKLRNKNTGVELEFGHGLDFIFRPYLEPKLMFYENPEHFDLFTNDDYFVYQSKTGKPWTLHGIMDTIHNIQLLPSKN